MMNMKYKKYFTRCTPNSRDTVIRSVISPHQVAEHVVHLREYATPAKRMTNI